jgi:signal transduction histidine kinase
MRNRLRLSTESLDRLLAVVLFIWAQLQIWLTHEAGHHRLLVALLSLLLCSALAVRRRYPALAGIGGNLAMAIGFWAGLDTQIFGTSIAWFCVVYGLTVWTTRRWFVIGVVSIAITDLGPLVVRHKHASDSFLFGVITICVMLLVRRVLGDRERRVALAERERDVAAREAVVAERARIARELHDAIAHNVSMMVVQAGA